MRPQLLPDRPPQRRTLSTLSMPRPWRKARSLKATLFTGLGLRAVTLLFPKAHRCHGLWLERGLLHRSLITQGTSFDARSRFTCCFTAFVRSIAAFAQSCSLAGRGVKVAWATA